MKEGGKDALNSSNPTPIKIGNSYQRKGGCTYDKKKINLNTINRH